MRKFVGDYIDLCKHGLDFLKKHWLGYIVVTIILSVIYIIAYCGYIFGWYGEIINKIKNKFGKKEIEVNVE